MQTFKYADWIWNDNSYTENEYVEFKDKFEHSGNKTLLRISVRGDYTVFINGKFALCNQYGDFEHYKVYDEIDITEYLTDGENELLFLVWYFGKNGMRYCTSAPGLIYEVITDEGIIVSSSSATLSGLSKAYKSGKIKKISPQLGYSYEYDATKGEPLSNDYSMSVVISDKSKFYRRPIEKLSIGELISGEVCSEDGSYIIDFGKELVGLVSLSFTSPQKQKINVAYGELLKNGHVKRIIQNRDFSFDYIAKCGQNNYTNYMFRVGCRYLEIKSQYPIDINCIGIFPQYYPTKIKEIKLENELDTQIYDICVNTLNLCMMEHYADCPWREQCLYAFDARNQMLAGYSAFENGNFEYARANLILMSKDKREDNLLSICFPSGEDMTIPSFSLYYILAVKEYMEYSNDNELGKEVFDKIKSILNTFVSNVKDGLVCKFIGKNHWNFYDWSPNANFPIGTSSNDPDFLLNSIFVIALSSFDDICRMIGEKNPYGNLAAEISENAHKTYFNQESGLYTADLKSKDATELANSLAVLSGIANGKNAEKICKKLTEGSLTECSLSMKTFKYDALLKMNKEKYKDVVLNEIRQNYEVMISCGSTTVWETAEGETAFNSAGSLCHGWSAMPVNYYNLF